MKMIKENVVRDVKAEKIAKFKKLGYVEFKPTVLKTEKKVSQMNKAELLEKATELKISLNAKKEYTNAELIELINASK